MLSPTLSSIFATHAVRTLQQVVFYKCSTTSTSLRGVRYFNCQRASDPGLVALASLPSTGDQHAYSRTGEGSSAGIWEINKDGQSSSSTIRRSHTL